MSDIKLPRRRRVHHWFKHRKFVLHAKLHAHRREREINKMTRKQAP